MNWRPKKKQPQSSLDKLLAKPLNLSALSSKQEKQTKSKNKQAISENKFEQTKRLLILNRIQNHLKQSLSHLQSTQPKLEIVSKMLNDFKIYFDNNGLKHSTFFKKENF